MSKLYIVGTPIGNLGDFSPRAVETLENCDFIAAEDTRVTVKLLNHFGIKKNMVSYFEHNRRERGEMIVSRILAGETCALVTDAGMPAISDPGEDLVKLCHENNIKVESVPGPCAFTTALALSGMPSGRFTFEGFLSVNKPSRREHLDSLVNETRTMLFYEAPHKLGATLRDMYSAFGDREIAIVREITKLHEEVIKTTLSKAAELYGEGGLKGEIVLVIHGAEVQKNDEKLTLEDAVALAKKSAENGLSLSEAAKQAAKISGFKKGEIYKKLLGE
ncbi:MAG: 16S rRNA (cytidine(1402)-2'-O)-methyltransferase [Clostridia bacterium]|nr:16S rRNA (cytidine(1402)-2'-O)-methyltransferase [Clostridia bacterium]MBQ3129168.1 16S rRNA (cytidine(1402)-2'-O)-methyltransferase [Clostridia bacterium]MBQ7044678.1 16S rRNA (cytidine(1402)-2'-O)-methyltransferase [Clostridia bacterium]